MGHIKEECHVTYGAVLAGNPLEIVGLERKAKHCQLATTNIANWQRWQLAAIPTDSDGNCKSTLAKRNPLFPLERQRGTHSSLWREWGWHWVTLFSSPP